MLSLTFTDSDQLSSVLATVEKNDSTNLRDFRYTFDPDLPEKNWEACTTGDTAFTVHAPVDAQDPHKVYRLRMKVAEVNKASRPGNVIFSAVKTRIAQ